MELAERVAKLEVLTGETRSDVAEIKADVKLLLESKWKADGRAIGMSTIVAFLVSLLGIFLKK